MIKLKRRSRTIVGVARAAALVPAASDTAEPRPMSLSPAELNAAPPLVFTTRVMDEIMHTIGSRPAESGGPLGGSRGGTLMESFWLDETARMNGAQYYPDVDAVNQLMREQWNPRGTNLLGFVHSHPAGFARPSSTDCQYAGRIMDAIPELRRFALPIVQTTPDTGSFGLHGWSAVRRGNDVVVEGQSVVLRPAPSEPKPTEDPAWARVHEAYDLRAMSQSRFVSIGCGGAAAFLEDLARAGVGEFVLIDPDQVEPPNVGTQQTYLPDVGRSKAKVIGERLLRVNPKSRVWVVPERLEDLTDEAVGRLASGWLPGPTAHVPTATLLGAFTDDFHAQARVARLGLHLGVPVLAATVYREGRGVEVTFAAPGVTPACIRCALRSRYTAYLECGFTNDVTSHGTPYSATMRLNALKMPIALGILHTVSPVADPDHPGTQRHRRFLEAVAHRNLALVSLDPDIGESLGLGLFDDLSSLDPKGRLPVDSTLWLEQLPDHPDNGYPQCPECGGSGDLRESISAFYDTSDTPLTYGDLRRRIA